MITPGLSIQGVGVVTDSIGSIAALADANEIAARWREPLSRAMVLPANSVAGQDALTQLALRAVHQAWTMAGLSSPPVSPTAGETCGLIVQSAWGTVDSTVAYLDSMFEADGRFASPRHFSRSVYSSVASFTAIHFGIKGPCETVTFGDDPISGALHQAWRLLATARCERVVICWAEQAGEVAADLARRAATHLRQAAFKRYAEQELGYGAVAIVAALSGGIVDFSEARPPHAAKRPSSGKPFAMDAAVDLLRNLLLHAE